MVSDSEVLEIALRTAREVVAAHDAEIARLTAELAKFQESSFNPDWSLLQATRGVVQEYREELEACKAELAAGKLMADFAKGAISDAIYTDDGLDGETGQRVLKIITEWQTSGTFDSALCDTLTGFETLLTKELTASQERERVLREVSMGVAASLAAAISLIEKSKKAVKKAAPSNLMFDLMLSDYKKSLEAWRAALGEP